VSKVGSAVLAFSLALGFGAGKSSAFETGAWVVRDGLVTPEGVARVCGEAAAAKLDTLVVQVRGRGDAYYRSRLAPRAEGLDKAPEGFDPLDRVLRSAGRARVLAWMNVFLVWGGATAPRDPLHPVRSHPEWVLRGGDGRPVSEYTATERALGWIEGTYFDPASEGYRRSFAELVREVAAQYPVAGVHLDFVRYPGPDYGYGGTLGEAFREAWGFDPRWIPEALRSPDLKAWAAGTMPAEDRALATAALLWADLRAAQVTELVRAARKALDSVRPGLELSAAVVPDAGPAYLEKGQDWRSWATLGLVDALYPMAYFGGPERVAAQLSSVSALVRREAPAVRLWAGLGAYQKTPAAIAEEASAARRMGYDGVCLFDAKALIAKPPGLADYAGAVRGRADRGAALREAPARPQPATAAGRRLAALVERASGGFESLSPVSGEILDARWAEFEAARRTAIPAALARLREKSQRTPAWVELRGVFRYTHPSDGAARREAQTAVCREARARLLAREPMERVARELSQGGTRNQGGVLGRRYLRPENPADVILFRLRTGEVSPVIDVENGCWVYRMESKGEGVSAPVDELAWPERRLLFRQALEQKAPAAAARPAASGG